MISQTVLLVSNMLFRLPWYGPMCDNDISLCQSKIQFGQFGLQMVVSGKLFHLTKTTLPVQSRWQRNNIDYLRCPLHVCYSPVQAMFILYLHIRVGEGAVGNIVGVHRNLLPLGCKVFILIQRQRVNRAFVVQATIGTENTNLVQCQVLFFLKTWSVENQCC